MKNNYFNCFFYLKSIILIVFITNITLDGKKEKSL